MIGAGQADLAMGYYLNQSKISYMIVDKNQRIGDIWRKRYDSLVLFSPKAYSSLPGMPLPVDSEDYPTKDEVADYLESYAKQFSIPVHSNTCVDRVESVAKGFKVSTTHKEYFAKKVVVATGPFQKPLVPPFSKSIPEDVLQIHSSEYRNSSQLIEGTVLVVGGGNSGAQIAVELSKEREVYLSVGHKLKFVPDY